MKDRIDEQIQHELAAMAERAKAGLPPVGARIESHIHQMLEGEVASSELPKLPREMFLLRSDQMAEKLAVPQGELRCDDPLVKSIICDNAMVYNPVNDIRTVQPSVFHVTKKGPKVPYGKIEVPAHAVARILPHAFNPPQEYNSIPYFRNTQRVEAMLAAYLRPLVSPKAGPYRRRTAEALVLAPGGLPPAVHFPFDVFEGGKLIADPWMEDASQEWKHWSGHTLGVVVAPHLTQLTKWELDLPYKEKTDLYNDGEPFHLHLRNEEGNYLLVAADSYFGYIKKGIKMMLRAIADLEGFGEEHSGMVLVAWDGRILHISGRGVSGAGKSELAKMLALLRKEGGTLYLRVGRRYGKVKSGNILAITSGTGDDLTAYLILPNGKGGYEKVAENIERFLFDRTDATKNRGEDPRTEQFLANKNIRKMVVNHDAETGEDLQPVIASDDFVEYDPAMQAHLRGAPHDGYTHTVRSDAHRMLANGKKTTNPRVLLPRELTHNIPPEVLAAHGIDLDKPMTNPVTCYLWGTRTNPPDSVMGTPAFCMRAPFGHLPVLTALIEDATAPSCKSPSTNAEGQKSVGLEGAGTVGPFNSLQPIHVLESTYLDLVFTGTDVFLTVSGHVGPDEEIWHDIRQLMPHVLVHMTDEERKAKNLIEDGYLEPYGDEELTTQLGYRITRKFVETYFGRILENPNDVITDEMLRPELQGLDVFNQSRQNHADAIRRAVEPYFIDGSVNRTCTGVQIMLHIAKYGHWHGKGPNDPEVRAWFDPEIARPLVFASDWYHSRLDKRQQREIKRVRRILGGMKNSIEKARVEVELQYVSSAEYRDQLVGTLGAALIESEAE